MRHSFVSMIFSIDVAPVYKNLIFFPLIHSRILLFLQNYIEHS